MSDRTVMFETYSRVCAAVQYDGTFEAIQAISAFAVGKVHLRFGTEPAFMGEHGLLNIRNTDWVVEIAEGQFILMSDGLRKRVFCPQFRSDLADDTVDALAFAVQTMGYDTCEAGSADSVHRYNELGMHFSVDLGREGGDKTVGYVAQLKDGVCSINAEMTEQLQQSLDDMKGKDIWPEGTGDMLLIRDDHPHSKLINAILANTGIAHALKGTVMEGAGALARDLSFEAAQTALRMGYRVDRACWNDNAWLCLGEERRIPPEGFWNTHTRRFAEAIFASDEAKTLVGPYLVAVEVHKQKVTMGYSLDGDDIFAKDWRILEG